MKTLLFCALLAIGFSALAVNLSGQDAGKQKIELIVVPDEQELYNLASKLGVIEVGRGNIDRVVAPGAGITYYIFDRERALRDRVKNSLTNIGKFDADIVIWPGHMFSEAIHLRLIEPGTTKVTHLRFDKEFLVNQTTEIAEQGEFPSEDARIEYSEYAYESGDCPELGSKPFDIPRTLANSLERVGLRPPTGTMRHIQVDGASFAVDMRTEFTEIHFTVGANSGPLWESVESVVNSVRVCSESQTAVARSY